MSGKYVGFQAQPYSVDGERRNHLYLLFDRMPDNEQMAQIKSALAEHGETPYIIELFRRHQSLHLEGVEGLPFTISPDQTRICCDIRASVSGYDFAHKVEEKLSVLDAEKALGVSSQSPPSPQETAYKGCIISHGEVPRATEGEVLQDQNISFEFSGPPRHTDRQIRQINGILRANHCDTSDRTELPQENGYALHYRGLVIPDDDARRVAREINYRLTHETRIMHAVHKAQDFIQHHLHPEHERPRPTDGPRERGGPSGPAM